MNEINKETSLHLLKLERENSKEAPEIIHQLLDSVEKVIEEDVISYYDFIEDMIKEVEKVPDADASSTEKREEIVNNLCQNLIDKYETRNKE